MDNFKGHDLIRLQPGDNDVQYDFDITTCTTAIANDGFLPFGRSVSSVAVSGYQEDNVTLANDMISGSISESADVVSVPLKYPAAGEGRYKLRFTLTLDDSSTQEADFNRIQAENL